MLGGMFAGTEEAPGEIELYQGRSYKSYLRHGLAGRDEPLPLPTAISKIKKTTPINMCPRASKGACLIKGPIAIIHQLMGGLRSSMGYLGCATIEQMHESRICGNHRRRHERIACA